MGAVNEHIQGQQVFLCNSKTGERRLLGYEDHVYDADGRRLYTVFGPDQWIDFGPPSEAQVFTVTRPSTGRTTVYPHPATDLLDLFNGEDRERVKAWAAELLTELAAMRDIGGTDTEVISAIPAITWDRKLTDGEQSQIVDYLKAIGVIAPSEDRTV